MLPYLSRNRKKILEEVRALLEKRSKKPLEMAMKAILGEKIQSKEISDALKYFTSYWRDLVRPTLMSICCESVGGQPDLTVPVAASITLICGATDIHDDLIDKSKTKMSRPTLLGKFNEDISLLVGDALLFKGFILLQKAYEKIPLEKMSHIFDVLSKMFFEMGDGEALELKFRGATNVTPEQYLRVVKMKAADVEACAKVGAIIGGGSLREINALGNYGRMLGTIMILKDDLADMVDYEELPHRIKHESLPLPLILALQDSEIKGEINPFIQKREISKKDMDRIFKLISERGVIEEVSKIIENAYLQAYLSIERIQKNEYLELLLDAAMLSI